MKFNSKTPNLAKLLFPNLILAILVATLLAFFGDFRKTAQALAQFPWQFAPIIILLSLINYSFRFLRWRLFGHILNIKLPILPSLLIFLSGLAMTITPARMGELTKAYFLKKLTHKPIAQTSAIVIVERLTDGIAMLILMSAGLIIHRYGTLAILIASLLCLMFILSIQYPKSILFISRPFAALPILSNYGQHFKKFLLHSSKLTQPKSLGAGIIFGLLAWSAECIGFYIVLKQLGINPGSNTLFTSFFIFGFAAMAGVSALLPGGLGVAEGTTTGLIILLLKAPKNLAVTAALIDRAFTLWLGVIIGLIALNQIYKNNKIIRTTNFKNNQS